MRTLRVLGIYALVVLAAALALSFPVQWLCEQFGWFVDKPWGKFFRRCAMLAAVVGLWPVLQTLGMATWGQMGLRSAALPAVVRTVGGWVLAFAAMMLLGGAALFAGDRVWNGLAWSDLLKPVAVGVGVGVFEEFFFRGVIFGALRREWGVARALWASSLLYAALHFWSAPPKELAGVLPAMVSLTGLGALLAWCYVRSGSLFLCVGVHAGAVAALRMLLAVTEEGRGDLGWLFGSGAFKLVNGAAAWPALAVLWLALSGFERVMTRFYDRGDQGMGERRAGAVLPG
ncbi:MAG: CPBP family intramembrane metalloprotease [Verrucomicrobia bacterium]|nr:CPBP family intramembrane metalloprotease [Verrucomicrobiota bacterium]